MEEIPQRCYISLGHASSSSSRCWNGCIIISYSSSALSLYISTIRPLDLNKLASPQNSSNPPVADDHLLPAPASKSSKSDAVKLDVSQSAASVKYDVLGPLVVNSDGVSIAGDG